MGRRVPRLEEKTRKSFRRYPKGNRHSRFVGDILDSQGGSEDGTDWPPKVSFHRGYLGPGRSRRKRMDERGKGETGRSEKEQEVNMRENAISASDRPGSVRRLSAAAKGRKKRSKGLSHNKRTCHGWLMHRTFESVGRGQEKGGVVSKSRKGGKEASKPRNSLKQDDTPHLPRK